jgi:hypothetical protein
MKRVFLAVTVLYSAASGAAYKCVDEKGVTLIGDTPPPGCEHVKMYETNRSGAVIRTIDPTPTAEELKAMQEAAAKRKVTDKAMGEQKRKDMALLNTYASEKEFDVARERNVEPVKSRIASAAERIAAVEKRQQEIEQEMEFYKAGKSKSSGNDSSKGLQADLDRARAEKAALVSSIAGYEKEIEDIKAKFETDKKRWLELKNPSKDDDKPADASKDGKDTKDAKDTKSAKSKDKDAKAPPKKS